jgi:ATP-dependent protease ClpP protease subunit
MAWNNAVPSKIMKTLIAVIALAFGCAATPVRPAAENIVGPVDEASLASLSARIDDAPAGPFGLHFVSGGGSVFDGLAFIRTMERAQGRGVVFVCTADFAASMAVVIFSACDERIAYPRAVFMIHAASSGGRGKAADLAEAARALEVISDAMFRQIATVLNISFKELKHRAGARDYWLDSGRALEIGLVQRVSAN